MWIFFELEMNNKLHAMYKQIIDILEIEGLRIDNDL